MEILVVGLSHKTAPIELRERLHIPERDLAGPLQILGQEPPILERVILSTCNRVEVYAVAEEVEPARQAIEALLGSRAHLPAAALAAHLYRHRAGDAVRHAFRVAASLDSLVVGEPQILGQVKEAYQAAVAAGAVGPVLAALMERALRVGKRIRTETALGASPVSVASVAIELARQIFGTLAGRTVLLLGAGEMSEAAAQHLKEDGVSAILVSNRRYERALELAGRLGGRAVRFDQFKEEVLSADIVIASTAAPHPILTRADVEQIIRARRQRPLFLIDIAVPRDIAADVNAIDNVYLYDIDDLEAVAAANRKVREKETTFAEAIVEREVEAFTQWLRSLDVVPTIQTLREKVEAIRDQELGKALHRLADLKPEQQAVVRQLAQGIVNKILHHPMIELKRQSARRDGHVTISALRRLFGLEEQEP
ncbi:MAG: glutamyl-tRNA reductase [candidate division NC10 bacterium]